MHITVLGNEIKTNEESAMLLKEIGVFKGSEAGFELERAPTRLEGLIMLLRLMGLEDEALNSKFRHRYSPMSRNGEFHIRTTHTDMT